MDMAIQNLTYNTDSALYKKVAKNYSGLYHFQKQQLIQLVYDYKFFTGLGKKYLVSKAKMMFVRLLEKIRKRKAEDEGRFYRPKVVTFKYLHDCFEWILETLRTRFPQDWEINQIVQRTILMKPIERNANGRMNLFLGSMSTETKSKKDKNHGFDGGIKRLQSIKRIVVKQKTLKKTRKEKVSFGVGELAYLGQNLALN